MDLHPLTVHFPIAFLCLFSVMELMRLKLFTRQTFWFPTKVILLVVGVLWALVSLQTGEEAAEAQPGLDPRVVILHANFALAATWVYVILAVAYLVTWLERGCERVRILCARTPIIRFVRWIASGPPAVVLAITGLALMTVVGALGASLVYGPDIDPAVGFIYHLLVR